MPLSAVVADSKDPINTSPQSTRPYPAFQ